MYGTYERLHVWVWASDEELIRAAWKKMTKKGRRDPKLREARKAFYREMLQYHHQAQELCKQFAL